MCVKPMCNEHNCLCATRMYLGQTHFRDRKSSRFSALGMLPPTMVFPQAQEPWIRFAWPHVHRQPSASTQPLAQQVTELHEARTQQRGFGVCAYHSPKFSQAERAILSMRPGSNKPVLQILLDFGFGFQQKYENSVSKEKNEVPQGRQIKQ